MNPVLYKNFFLEKNQTATYDRFMNLSWDTENSYNEWVNSNPHTSQVLIIICT